MRPNQPFFSGIKYTCSFILAGLVLIAIFGCRIGNRIPSDEQDFQSYLTQIEYPEIDEASFQSAQESLAEKPPSISEYEKLEFEELSLDDAIQMALTNSKVLSRIGGQVVANSNAAFTTFDPAIQESGRGGVENALSVFDARVDSSLNFQRNDTPIIGLFQRQFASQSTNSGNFNAGITKQTAWGSTFGIRNRVDYNRNNAPRTPESERIFGFFSTYSTIVQAEFRQALRRGAGSMVNRVAGPNSQPGVYNGVLIARINQDLSLADFETAVRDLVRDVERSYWELYFTYRNLDNLIDGRKATLENWRFRKTRDRAGIDEKHIVPQARQQYFVFETQVQNALAGLFSAERELRRLIGLNASGTTQLRPSTDPFIAKTEYDWDSLQVNAMEKRVELRRQQWFVKQKELEFLAAKNLNRWQLDFVANYGWRGFGDNLMGSRSRPQGSAYDNLLDGDLEQWNMGFEFGGPIGKRQTFVAVRNAELQLAKARTVLKEQQRQIVLNLNRAFVEVDRAYEGIRSNYNSREAINEEVEVRRKNREGGRDDPFFYLEALRRRANTESEFVRSLVDYNLALLDVSYESGELLKRYNIELAEGPWSEAAYQNAESRDLRFSE